MKSAAWQRTLKAGVVPLGSKKKKKDLLLLRVPWCWDGRILEVRVGMKERETLHFSYKVRRWVDTR